MSENKNPKEVLRDCFDDDDIDVESYDKHEYDTNIPMMVEDISRAKDADTVLVSDDDDITVERYVSLTDSFYSYIVVRSKYETTYQVAEGHKAYMIFNRLRMNGFTEK